MVGLFGIVGKQNHDIELFCDASHFYSSERKGIYEDDGLIIAYSDHPHNIESQPKQADGDLLWIWGDVVGHERKGHYTSKPQNIDQSKYCLELYKKYGVPFVAGLNSDFAGIIYNKEKETVSLFTDRLSSRPIYYTWGKKIL